MPNSAAGPGQRICDIPSAFDHASSLEEALGGGQPLLFLDFDGTLAPIVEDPRSAASFPGISAVLRELVTHVPVAVLSGRERTDVEARVDVEGVIYAGSHGLDIQGPDVSHLVGEEAIPALRRVREMTRSLLDRFPGVHVEAKSLGVAVHYRTLRSGSAAELEELLSQIAEKDPTLRMIRGKKVFELRPALEWNKGHALRWLVDRLAQERDAVVPIYIGDDLTDEDAFEALGAGGIGVVVRGETDDRLSLARYALSGPDEVLSFLRLLVGLVENRSFEGARRST